jgi:mannose-6-phosphate isomerase-like protein (cupin superfamily)
MAARRSFTIRHRTELERSGRWFLARRSLGVESFGMNLVEIASGDRIPEHDEIARDQEEVFAVLSGDAIMVVDGREHPAPAGTFVRVGPELSRSVLNAGQEPVTLLIVSAPTTSGYEPADWT